MTPRSRAQIQRPVFDEAPRVFAFHPANGGYRKPIDAAVLKGPGVSAGVPDVIAGHEGRCYGLEAKALGNRRTEAQLATIAAMEAAGTFGCIAEGVDPALAALEALGLLRGQASITPDKQVSR